MGASQHDPQTLQGTPMLFKYSPCFPLWRSLRIRHNSNSNRDSKSKSAVIVRVSLKDLAVS